LIKMSNWKSSIMNKILIVAVIALWNPAIRIMAQGDLLVTPNRVVFEGNKQNEQLNLLNMGQDTATYSISFVQRNMKEDGSFVKVEKPDSGQLFADPYLRIFPRQVTLAPREPQVILVQFRRKANMIAGEYRSHLYFRSEQNYKPLGLSKSDNDSTLLNVQLIPIFGVSIPIIIRTGLVNVSATLSNLELVNQGKITQKLKFTINRKGNISLYGDIIVKYIPLKGKPSVIAKVAGVGVYTNISKRNIILKLNNTTTKALEKGKLSVQYISRGKLKPIVFAEAKLDIKQVRIM